MQKEDTTTCEGKYPQDDSLSSTSYAVWDEKADGNLLTCEEAGSNRAEDV